jgi:hypothetical protein
MDMDSLVWVVLVETAKVYRPQNLLRLPGGAPLSTCSLVQPAPRNKQSRTRPRACFPLRPVVPEDAASAHVVASAETDPAFPSGNRETTSGKSNGRVAQNLSTLSRERGTRLPAAALFNPKGPHFVPSSAPHTIFILMVPCPACRGSTQARTPTLGSKTAGQHSICWSCPITPSSPRCTNYPLQEGLSGSTPLGLLIAVMSRQIE